MLLQVLLNGIISGLLYSITALGFSLIYSSTRFFDLGYGAIYTLAAYFFLEWKGFFTTVLGQGWAVASSTSVFLSIITVSLLSIVIEKSIYQPLFKKGATALVAFISSLGLYIIVVNSLALYFGNETKLLSSYTEPALTLGKTVITRIQIAEFTASIITLLSVFLLLKKTSLGRNIRALSDNPTLLNVLGINPARVRLLVFIIGSSLAATASLLKGSDVGVDPYVGLSVILTAAVAVIIGGVGHHGGAVLGALLLGITQNMAVFFVSAQWRESIIFVVLVIVLLVRKEGMLALRLRPEEI